MTPPKLSKYESRKKNHADMVKDLLTYQTGERHFKICFTCQVDCEVARKAFHDHWANEGGEPPKYNIDTCPKAENIDRLIKAKAMKRFRGRAK
jgi:hypothetical protein